MARRRNRAERDKAKTDEERKLRKAANLNKPGAAKASEPDWGSDDGLAEHTSRSRRRSRSRGAR